MHGLLLGLGFLKFALVLFGPFFFEFFENGVDVVDPEDGRQFFDGDALSDRAGLERGADQLDDLLLVVSVRLEPVPPTEVKPRPLPHRSALR